MNNKGFTLVELIVYIAMVGIISILILSQMKMINLNFVSGRRVSALQSESRDVAAMLVREIRNTGFKTVMNVTGTNTLQKLTVPGTFFSSDSSSFIHKEGDPSDTLIILKARIDNAGIYEGVDTIEYHLDGSVLKRVCGDVVIELASNVQALQFQYGVFDLEATLIDESSVVATNWTGTNCVVSEAGGGMEITVSSATTGNVSYTSAITFGNDLRVWLEFRLEPASGFSNALEFVEWAVSSSGGTVLSSERFLPGDLKNKILLPVPQASNTALSLRFKSSAAGKLLLKEFMMRRADLGRYVWKDEPTTSEKKSVKAIRLGILTRSSSETNMRIQTPVTVGNVTVNRSGNYSWRNIVETVEVPNNGTF